MCDGPSNRSPTLHRIFKRLCSWWICPFCSRFWNGDAIALGTSATSLIKKVGPYLDLVNKFFGLLFFIVGIWLLERIISIQVAAYLWAILPITVIVLINTNKSKIQTSLRNFFSTTVTLVMSAYAVLLNYGANVNQIFIPITSFIE